MDDRRVLLNIYSYLSYYESLSFIPFVSKQWRNIFENYTLQWQSDNPATKPSSSATTITTTNARIPHQVITLYEIWRYSCCEGYSANHFLKLMDSRMGRNKLVVMPCSNYSWKNWLSNFVLCGLSPEVNVDNDLEILGQHKRVLCSEISSGSTEIIQVRVQLIGDDKVGKSCLYRSMVKRQAVNVNQNDSVGNLFNTREFHIRGDQYSILVVDGPTRSDIEIVLLCFDITNLSSFHSLQERWARKTMQLQRIVVGLKSDESKQSRQVSRKQAEQLALQLGTIYVEVSAKKYWNVSQLYSFILFSQVYKRNTGYMLGSCAEEIISCRQYLGNDDDLNEI